MNVIQPEIEKLFRAKEKRRSQLADMPFPDKVQAVVQLQRMAAPVLCVMYMADFLLA
ncbi:MAG: hypothetical protein AAB308_06920 [Nitrospirota bacterium]